MFSRLMQLWIPKRPSKATLFEMTCSKFITNSASALLKSNIKGNTEIFKYVQIFMIWLVAYRKTGSKFRNQQNPTTKTPNNKTIKQQAAKPSVGSAPRPCRWVPPCRAMRSMHGVPARFPRQRRGERSNEGPTTM